MLEILDFLLLLLATAAAAPASNFPAALPGIETVVVFPGVHDSRFALGDVHTQVIGVKNNANEAVNITHIHGGLKSPFDFNYNIQNFTQLDLGMTLTPGESVSLLYRYAPYTSLDPMAFHLFTYIVYHTDSEVYASTVHNKTIELYEPSSDYDFKKVFKFVTGSAAALLFGYVVFKFSRVEQTKKQKKSKQQSGAAVSNENEWIAPVASQRHNSGKGKKK